MSENNSNKPQVNPTAKYLLIAVAAVLVFATVLIVLFGSKSSEKVDTTVDVTASEQTEEHEPVFMYFVTKSDEGYDDYMKMVDELQAQYKDKVKFDIVDIDEKPEAKENFPVEGQTPVLIMTNKSNDISAIEFMCTDKARLTEDIENTLK